MQRPRSVLSFLCASFRSVLSNAGCRALPDFIYMSSSRPSCGEIRRVAIDLSRNLNPHGASAEIRDFPKGLSTNSLSDLIQICAQGVRNCINLRSCTWTRDGSLHSAVLESLVDCPQLRELEINGNDSGYDPILLARFSRLSKISLIMPSTHVLDILPTWISITGETLRSLTILCRVR